MSATSLHPSTYITQTDVAEKYPSVTIKHPSGKSSVSVYLNGATVHSWKILETELLFVSEKNVLAAGKPLRGGIPVVFPQFGPGALPQHGFARNQTWKHAKTDITTHNDITAHFILSDNEETRAVWPFHFTLDLMITLQATALAMQLSVENTDSKPFSFTTLLHTYFHVADIHKTSIHGLRGIHYIDKTRDGKEVTEENDAIKFTEETDRIYIGGGERTVDIDDGGNGRIIVKSIGFADFVVWNPAQAKADSMKDLGGDNYPKFVCVEAGSVYKPVELEAGRKWIGSQGLSLRLID